MEKKARFGTGEGHTVLDKDNLAVSERYVLPHSGKGVQLPFQTTPDSPRVIPVLDCKVCSNVENIDLMISRA